MSLTNFFYEFTDNLNLKTSYKNIALDNFSWKNIKSAYNNNKFKILISSTFNKVNRLFVLSFQNEDDRTCFCKYYTPSVEIKDFNVLIDGKSFLTPL